MKLLVKTLKGEKFEIHAEESQTVADVKGIIEATKSELSAGTLKLIHSGKVLKDEDSIASAGIKENDFLVVMVTKAKKPVAAKPAATPTPVPAATPGPPVAAAASIETPAPTAAATPAAPTRADDVSAEAVANLTSMGFPEAEVKHCLRAAHGNPDIAVEFLTNGIPEGVAEAAAAMNTSAVTSPSASSESSSGSGQPLQALRNHPQFNDLRRLVQSNPQMLQQVLTQIGQQQPQLLQEINANQALFLQIMNEPVESSASVPVAPAISGSSDAPSLGGLDSGAAAMMEGMGNPAQMAQMIQGMSPEELSQMAAMMGLSPDQLRQTAQMIGQMPPEQLSQFMMQAMGGGEGPESMGGSQVLRLTEEEMAAVDRLAEMGFDRSEAAQAFLACDKNEALAANLLMDSMGDGGGAFGFDGSGNGNGDNGDGGDGDDMYD